MGGEAASFALGLFRRSVLKQEKYRHIVSLLDGTENKTCLDIGGDNGIISFLLRRRGGTWYSADLDERTVESIRQLVTSNVVQIDGLQTPFSDSTFDCVVIVDFLEHVETDREFVREVYRILKSSGHLIVNVPHLKPRSLLNRIRHAIGQTDEKHGHVRAGYDREGLAALLRPYFAIRRARTYSGTFSELVDTLLTAGYQMLQSRKRGVQSLKGTVVTQSDLRQHRKGFLILTLTYPLIWTISRLDRLLFFQSGYKLIVRADPLEQGTENGEPR